MNKKYKIALCSVNVLGVITSNEKTKVCYPDGNTGYAYTGYCIHTTLIKGIKKDEGKLISIPQGNSWCSKSPVILGEVEINEKYEQLEDKKFFCEKIYKEFKKQNIIKDAF